MNLPRGTLKNNDEWKNARPVDYLAKIDLDFTGVIRFFERGEDWNVFFLLVEDTLVIGYCSIKGQGSLEDELYAKIEQCEVEIREFTPSEMKIAQDLNAEYILSEPVKISEILPGKESQVEMVSESFFPDKSLIVEIKKAKKFREEFFNRRSQAS
jgi:hypothetical protein